MATSINKEAGRGGRKVWSKNRPPADGVIFPDTLRLVRPQPCHKLRNVSKPRARGDQARGLSASGYRPLWGEGLEAKILESASARSVALTDDRVGALHVIVAPLVDQFLSQLVDPIGLRLLVVLGEISAADVILRKVEHLTGERIEASARTASADTELVTLSVGVELRLERGHLLVAERLVAVVCGLDLRREVIAEVLQLRLAKRVNLALIREDIADNDAVDNGCRNFELVALNGDSCHVTIPCFAASRLWVEGSFDPRELNHDLASLSTTFFKAFGNVCQYASPYPRTCYAACRGIHAYAHAVRFPLEKSLQQDRTVRYDGQLQATLFQQ